MALLQHRVRFAPTRHGRVAYTAMGGGPPLLYMPAGTSHLELYWALPGHRRLIEALAAHHTVIRCDRLGCGLSEPDRTAFTVEVEVESQLDLLDHLGIRRTAVLGQFLSGPIALHLAADFSHRVRQRTR